MQSNRYFIKSYDLCFTIKCTSDWEHTIMGNSKKYSTFREQIMFGRKTVNTKTGDKWSSNIIKDQFDISRGIS